MGEILRIGKVDAVEVQRGKEEGRGKRAKLGEGRILFDFLVLEI
jgi:hypothetical protein